MAVSWLLVSIGAAGCGPSGKPAKRAHLAVVNASDRAWRIVVVPAAGHEARTWTVDARQTLEADVPAGDYEVEQTLISTDGQAAETRLFPARLERGQSYRWRLATLLSESP